MAHNTEYCVLARHEMPIAGDFVVKWSVACLRVWVATAQPESVQRAGFGLPSVCGVPATMLPALVAAEEVRADIDHPWNHTIRLVVRVMAICAVMAGASYRR